MSWRPSSLRLRLLVWYSSILLLVIATFGGSLGYVFWLARIAAVDRTLTTEADSLAAGITPLADGGFTFERPDVVRRADRLGLEPLVEFALWNADGEVIDRFPVETTTPLTVPGAPFTINGQRVLARTAAGGARLVVAKSVADVNAEVVAFAEMAVGAGALALALSLVGGWVLVGRALAPIASMGTTARAMTGGDLSARIAIDRTDNELGQLASSLNAAFDRLCGLMDRQQRFAADASHELRTPLATVTMETAWALEHSRSEEDYRGALQSCQRAAARMTRMVERLLDSARAREVQPLRDAVALDRLVQDVVEMMRPLAEKKQVGLSADITPASVDGDQDWLTDAVINLVANAVEYTPAGGHVALAIASEPAGVSLTVRDTGIGIPDADLPFVFDRFFRSDTVRGAESGGVGLGLAIVREVVEAHGGRVSCRSQAGAGAEFTVTLPSRTSGAASGHTVT